MFDIETFQSVLSIKHDDKFKNAEKQQTTKYIIMFCNYKYKKKTKCIFTVSHLLMILIITTTWDNLRKKIIKIGWQFNTQNININITRVQQQSKWEQRDLSAFYYFFVVLNHIKITLNLLLKCQTKTSQQTSIKNKRRFIVKLLKKTYLLWTKNLWKEEKKLKEHKNKKFHNI